MLTSLEAVGGIRHVQPPTMNQYVGKLVSLRVKNVLEYRMGIENGEPTQSGNTGSNGCLILIVGLIVLYVLIGVGNNLIDRMSSPEPTRTTTVRTRTSTGTNSSGLREVRNDCGACGTNSPVGGWESANGRSLVLSENDNFVAFFEDNTSMSGTWQRSGGQLCLSPDLGGRICFSYEQKIDAMKLDDAIYIRR